ncbi:MAG: Fe-S-containing protein [Lachnotalea sp.]
MANQKNTKSNKSIHLVIMFGVGVIIAAGIFLTKMKNDNNQVVASDKQSTIEAQVSESGDLIIPIADITEKANFYGYDVDGTPLEVIAIKASDGSIRTAFNTCQVCYSSGRGYYVQEGDNLVCQNCGNQFSASDVEVSRGGCNPVPIMDENKVVDETNITIPKDFLESSKAIFENWKF